MIRVPEVRGCPQGDVDFVDTIVKLSEADA